MDREKEKKKEIEKPTLENQESEDEKGGFTEDVDIKKLMGCGG